MPSIKVFQVSRSFNLGDFQASYNFTHQFIFPDHLHSHWWGFSSFSSSSNFPFLLTGIFPSSQLSLMGIFPSSQLSLMGIFPSSQTSGNNLKIWWGRVLGIILFPDASSKTWWWSRLDPVARCFWSFALSPSKSGGAVVLLLEGFIILLYISMS